MIAAIQQNSLNAAYIKETGASGSVLTSNGTSSDPSWQTPGIISTWHYPISSNTAMVPFHGYITNTAGVINFTLPTTASIGDLFAAQNQFRAGSFTISTSNGTIYYLDNSIASTLTSPAGCSSILLRCFSAGSPSPLFTVISTNGAIFTTS